MNAAHVPAVTRTNTIALVIALVVAAATLLAAITLLSSDDLPDVGVPAGESRGGSIYDGGDWKDTLVEQGSGTGAAEVDGQARSGRLP